MLDSIEVLIRQYCLQIQVDRILKNPAIHGSSIPGGSITGGSKLLAPLFDPIYATLEERSKQPSRRTADETRWSVFETSKA